MPEVRRVIAQGAKEPLQAMPVPPATLLACRTVAHLLRNPRELQPRIVLPAPVVVLWDPRRRRTCGGGAAPAAAMAPSAPAAKRTKLKSTWGASDYITHLCKLNKLQVLVEEEEVDGVQQRVKFSCLFEEQVLVGEGAAVDVRRYGQGQEVSSVQNVNHAVGDCALWGVGYCCVDGCSATFIFQACTFSDMQHALLD